MAQKKRYQKHSDLFPLAVILDIDFSGYGIVRSLTSQNIPVIAFCHKKKFIPESKTRLCKVIRYSDENDLMEKLFQLGNRQLKPVLFLTSDYYVSLILKHRPDFEKRFHFNYPSNEVMEILLSKKLFYDFGIRNNILLPKSYDIISYDQLINVTDTLDYPVIIKPHIRKRRWTEAKMPKAFYCEDKTRLISAFERAFKYDHNLLLQEWIPGGDDNIYYCLTYFDELSECKASFSGQKLRQWPVSTGSTASTKPSEDDTPKKETIRIFSAIKFNGFGSIEYKKHALNGKYYLIEPTAGRLNQQEYVATANGINIPLIGYCNMTGININHKINSTRPVTYVDELAEISSAFVHFRKGLLTVREWSRSLKGRKDYRYFNYRDPSVFFAMFLKMPNQLIKNAFRRNGRLKESFSFKEPDYIGQS